MNNCETCRCNKVCDHNRVEFEDCKNYVPAAVAIEHEELILLRQENHDLSTKLEKLLVRTSPKYKNYCKDVAVITERINVTEKFSVHLKGSAVGVINLGERYFCIKESDIDDFVERVRNNL